MAKLKARGRQEIWKVALETNSPSSDLTTWEKHEQALMSDGSVLERRVVRFKPDRYEPKGKLHDYGWKVKGKIKPESTPAKLLEIFQRKGYVLVGVPKLDSWNANYAKAFEASKRKMEKSAVKRAAEAATKNGPGFYVTNGRLHGTGMIKSRVAELGPYTSRDVAEEHAWKRYREFTDMRLTYLLPVQVVEAKSRAEAEEGRGYVWWTNGLQKGPPVSPGQLRLAGINNGDSA